MSWFGDLIAATGKNLGLPELGISEKFGSTGARNSLPTPQAKVTNAMANTIGDGMRAVGGFNSPSSQPVASAAAAMADNLTQAAGNVANGPAVSYDPAAVKAAQDASRREQLKGEAGQTLDQLYTMYDEIIKRIAAVGGDATNRINKDFDSKIQDQATAMNEGMYDVDVAAAAGNLADSSWRSFDRGKVRTAADANIKTLNTERSDSLADVGSMVASDTAKYTADRDGIARTRQQLGASQSLDEVQSAANTLDANKRGVQADMAKYGTKGEFTQKANSVGKYDTSTLEATLQSVVQNASATPATKAAAINDLLNGTQIEDGEKERLKNKYTQTV